MHISNPGKTHIPCVLLVDTSAAMEGGLIRELNQGIASFIEMLRHDDKLRDCTDLCVIRYDGMVEVVRPFTSVNLLKAPTLRASELFDCAMNEAIITALDVINQRKQEYIEAGVDFWRPWLFLVTGFLPSDVEYTDAAVRRLREAVDGNIINYLQIHSGSAELSAKLMRYGRMNGVVAKGKIMDGFWNLKAEMAASVNESQYGSLSEIEIKATPFNIHLNT